MSVPCWHFLLITSPKILALFTSYSDNMLLQEALSLSTTLHNKGVFSWVSFFKSICDMIGIDPESISQGSVDLLRNKLDVICL